MTLPASGYVAQTPAAHAVLEYWFQDALELGWPSARLAQLWFGGGAKLDQEIDGRFGDLVRSAVAGGLVDWETTPLDRLALVVLLDQFTRNVFRAQPQAFAGDHRAQALVLDAFAQGWDSSLPLAGRVFLAMPLTHAESLPLQNDAAQQFLRMLAVAGEAQREDVAGFVRSAEEHRAIITTFGRFPHRNAVLGRESTAQELEFLRRGPRFGQ